MNQLPVLSQPTDVCLPDTDQWRFRFKIRSESSNRLYTIAQNIKGLFWGCSCPGWKANRHCKHLTAMGIPGDLQPYEVEFKRY